MCKSKLQVSESQLIQAENSNTCTASNPHNSLNNPLSNTGDTLLKSWENPLSSKVTHNPLPLTHEARQGPKPDNPS